MKETSKAVQKITRAYIFALSLIAVLLLSGQGIVQLFLEGQREDSKVVNISGRQRMLSQQLTKIVLLIKDAKDEGKRIQQFNNFRKSFQLFVLSHNNLTGVDNTLIQKIDNSPEVLSLYQKVEPFYKNIVSGGRKIILSTTEQDSLKSEQLIEEGTLLILNNEASFLPIMNTIVKTYEEESRETVGYLSKTELVILIISLLVLVGEIIFIFRPVTAYLSENDEVKKLNRELQEANEESRSQREELQQQTEELRTNNDFIEQVRRAAEEKNKELEAQAELMQRQHDKLESSTKKVNESIRYAERIQRAMFVRRKKIRDSFVDNFIVFMPRDMVSGDFYWFKERKNRKLLAVVDCTGHGVPGAFMSLIGMDLMAHICAGRHDIKPDEVLTRLHRGIKKLLKQDQGRNRDGMDASICVYDENTQQLEFAGAKQHLYYFRKLDEVNTELCVQKGSVYPIGGGKLPPNKEAYRNYHLTVLDANEIYCYYMMSDGFVDQFGAETGRKFLSSRFKDKLIEIHQLPMRKQQQILEQIFEEWKGDTAQIDDVLVTGVKL